VPLDGSLVCAPCAGTTLAELGSEPTEAELLTAQGVTTRTVGRDLYEVVRDGIAAGRVAMVEGARWVGYDLAGTARTEPLDSLADAVLAVDALGATPDAPRGARCAVCGGAHYLAEHGAPRPEARAAQGAVIVSPNLVRREQVSTAVATWGGRLADGPAAVELLDLVVAPPAEVDGKLAELRAAHAAARAIEAGLPAGTDERRLAGRRRRAAGRRVIAAGGTLD
jgi:hypothetical protein